MKSNFQMVRTYEHNVKNKGFCTKEEVNKIIEHFNIKNRQDIELQNLRDFIVMYYSNKTKELDIVKNYDEVMKIGDAISAITYIIDTEKFNRGMEV